MSLGLVTIAERPDLAGTVARWTWAPWGRAQGETLAQRSAAVASRTAGTGLEQCLVAQNAASRPDLSPWLASLHVEPRFRGIGIAPVLVTVVEAAACRSDFGRRWLFADGQVPLRASLAWVEHGVLHDHGRPCVLMRRDRRAG